MKLKAKVAWLIAVSVLLAIVLVAVLFYVVSSWIAPGYNHLKLQAMSEELSGRLAHTDLSDKTQLAREIALFLGEYDNIGADLFSADGQLLYSSETYSLPETMARLSNPIQRMFTGKDVSFVHEVPIGEKNHFVVFHVKSSAVQPMQLFIYMKDWTMLLFLVFLTLIIVLPALIAFVFILWMTRRLNRLNKAMQNTDLSREPVPLRDNRRDEIGELTKLYNEMTAKLHDQYLHIRQIEEARTKLVSQLSHDLRTPLSIIQGYAETLQRGSALETDTRLRHATIILQKADYMNELLHKLFRLAQLDDPSQAFHKSEGYLDTVLQNVMADYILILNDKGFEWHLDLPASPVALTFHRDGLTQVLRNLIDNAILHGADGKYLGVRLKAENGMARIEIEDRGKGIPPQEVEHIFEPFYRVNRGRPTDGLGIGLTLVNTIVKLHGGTIEVSSVPSVGTVFSVFLPMESASPASGQQEGAAPCFMLLNFASCSASRETRPSRPGPALKPREQRPFALLALQIAGKGRIKLAAFAVSLHRLVPFSQVAIDLPEPIIGFAG